MAKEPQIRDAEAILKESQEKEKEIEKRQPDSTFNTTTVEMDLAKARNRVATLNNRMESLNREMDEVRKELEDANKLKTLLDAAKAQVMEIDRLKEKQNGHNSK